MMICIKHKLRNWLLVLFLAAPMSGYANICDAIPSFTLPLGDGLSEVVNYSLDFITGGNKEYLKKSGLTTETVLQSLWAGPVGPIFVTLIAHVLGKNIYQLEKSVFSGGGSDDAMRRAIKLGGSMIDSSIDSVFKAAGAQFIIEGGGALLGGMLSKIPLVGSGLEKIIKAATSGAGIIIGFYIGFVLLFLLGGVMLYFFLPLIPVIAFFAMVINWFLMIFINMLGAPVFCFNLIRSDGEGMIGRGEKYIADIIRTMITPAVLTIGMVAFLILFNTLFSLLTSMFAYLFPIISGIYGKSPYITMVTYTLMLVAFATMVLFIAQTLATLCTAHAVRTVGAMIGETVHNIAESGPVEQMRGAVSGAGGQVSGKVKEIASVTTGGKTGGGGGGGGG